VAIAGVKMAAQLSAAESGWYKENGCQKMFSQPSAWKISLQASGASSSLGGKHLAWPAPKTRKMAHHGENGYLAEGIEWRLCKCLAMKSAGGSDGSSACASRS